MIRKPLLTLMLAMIEPGSVGRNAAQAEGLAGDATLSEEMLNTPGCMRSISPVLSKVQTLRQRRIASGAKAIFAAFALFAASTRSARAEDAGSSFLTQTDAAKAGWRPSTISRLRLGCASPLICR